MALAFKRSQAEIAALVAKEETHLQSVFGKKVTLEIDYESIKQFTGNAGSSQVTKQESVFKGIKCWILKDAEGQGLCGTLKYTLGKDAFGKEAFLETFDKIKLVFVPGEDKTTVAKDGKTLVVTFATAADNEYGCASSNWCTEACIGKEVEKLL